MGLANSGRLSTHKVIQRWDIVLDLIRLNNIAFSDIVCRFLSLKMILAGFPQEEKFPRNTGLRTRLGGEWAEMPSGCLLIKINQRCGYVPAFTLGAQFRTTLRSW